MAVMKDLFYTDEHEWVRVDGNIAIIGIADHAQEQLGEIVYVELPEIDDEIDKGEDFSAVESVKAASDIYMPVSGKILEINEELVDEPELLNKDVYANWMIKVEMSDKDEIKELMTSEEYERFLDEEE